MWQGKGSNGNDNRAINRRCTYRTDVAEKVSEKREEKMNRRPTRLYAVDGKTATETNWNELCHSMSTGYVRGSIEHVLRLSSAPSSKPPPMAATHWCTCNINHWPFLFRAILYQHLWYHFKGRNQSIKYRIKSIR